MWRYCNFSSSFFLSVHSSGNLKPALAAELRVRKKITHKYSKKTTRQQETELFENNQNLHAGNLLQFQNFVLKYGFRNIFVSSMFLL